MAVWRNVPSTTPTVGTNRIKVFVLSSLVWKSWLLPVKIPLGLYPIGVAAPIPHQVPPRVADDEEHLATKRCAVDKAIFLVGAVPKLVKGWKSAHLLIGGTFRYIYFAHSVFDDTC